MLRPRWRKLCTELAHALRSHVISQHDNEVKSRWPCDAFVIHARFVHDEIINLAARRFARNYIVEETDEGKKRRLPKLPQATRLDQVTIKVYSQNYLLRCSDRQQELCTSRISFQLTRDSRSAFNGFYSKLYFTMNSLEHRQCVTLLNNIFVYNFHYIYFPKTIPSKIYYHCIAALYINTTVSFKSSITKIYHFWPPIFDPM